MSIILVVDDDPTVCKLVKAYLDSTKYQVLESKDAYEAEDIIYKYHVSLVLIDINMPFKNGFSFAEQLKRSSRSKNLSFVFMTARSEKRDIERAATLNASGYIIKPFTQNDLNKKIDDIFEKGKLTSNTYNPINLADANLSGTLYYPIEFRVETLSELGITVLCNQSLVEQPTLVNEFAKSQSKLWSLIGIEAPNMSLNTCEHIPNKEFWRANFLFKNIDYESLTAIKNWIERTQFER